MKQNITIRNTNESEEARKAVCLEQLAQDRQRLLMRWPFIGGVIMRMELVPVRDDRLDTASTDGDSIFVDIDFYAKLTKDERLFVLAHEVWHSVLLHFVRRQNRDRELFNIAADLEIHFTLDDEKMHEPFVLPHDPAWKGLSAEEIYERLPDFQKNRAQQKKPSAGGKMQGEKTAGGALGDGQSSFDKHVYKGDTCSVPETQASEKNCPVPETKASGKNCPVPETKALGKNCPVPETKASEKNCSMPEAQPSGKTSCSAPEVQASEDAPCPMPEAQPSGKTSCSAPEVQASEDAPCPVPEAQPSEKEFVIDKDYAPCVSGEAVERSRSRTIASAQQVERLQGKLPAGIRKLLDKLQKPSLPWQEMLKQFVTTCYGGKRRWLPPARRHVWQELYLPSMRDEALKAVVAIDTSGSTMHDLPIFFAELVSLMKSFGKFELDVIQCDAKIQDVEHYSEANLPAPDKKWKVKGFGGTDFRPVFDYIKKKMHTQPNLLLFFTDGYGDAPTQRPAYPVMWVLTHDGKQPADWGRVTHFKKEV